MSSNTDQLTNGRAAAAVVAGGIGCLAMGLFSTLSEVSGAVGRALNFYNPVGNLSGKTLVTVVVWLVCWALLGQRWKDQDVNFGKLFTVALVMVGLGFLGTFPPFFDLIAD